MTTSNTRRGHGRSPELQQLLDEAVGVPMLPVERLVPGQRGAGGEQADRGAGVPVQRTGRFDAAPQVLEESTEPGHQQPAATRTAHPLTARRPRRTPTVRTAGRKRELRSISVLGAGSVMGSGAAFPPGSQPTVQGSGLGRAARRRTGATVGPTGALHTTLAGPGGRTRSNQRPARRRVADPRPFRSRSAGLRSERPTDLVGRPTADTRTRQARLLRNFVDRPVISGTGPASALGAESRRWLPMSDRASASPAARSITRPIDRRETVAPAPAARNGSVPPPAPDVFPSTRPVEASYPIKVARAAIVSAPARAREARELRERQLHRRRAVVLAGGVAAAVIAIVAIVVFAIGPRSGTASTADHGVSPSSSPTAVRAAGAAKPAATKSTAEKPAATKPAAKKPAATKPTAKKPAGAKSAGGATAAPHHPSVKAGKPTTAAKVPGVAATQPTVATQPTAATPTSNDVAVAAPKPTDQPAATPTPAPTPASTSSSAPAPGGGGGDTATVVTGVSKLTGWVPLTTPPNP